MDKLHTHVVYVYKYLPHISNLYLPSRTDGSVPIPLNRNPSPYSSAPSSFFADSLLPHESQIIRELSTPLSPIKQPPVPETHHLASSHLGTLYFDSYVDYFVGCANETETSLSSYTTEEVWNLIKEENTLNCLNFDYLTTCC